MRKIILTVLFNILLFQNLLSQQTIAGEWYGTLSNSSGEITITLSLTSDPLSGNLSSSLGLKGLKLKKLELTGDDFSFKVPSFGVTYQGKFTVNEISGIWKQGKSEVQLNFFRSEKKVELREQTPKTIEGYKSELIQFTQSNDQTLLSATLTIPEGEGPFPAAILLSVAGANDRDQTHSGGHKPFLVLSDYLSKNGFAVLRCDDRGVGESSGDLFKCDFSTLTNDALSAYQYLVQREDIDPQKIGFIGNSEGTVIGGMAAIKEPNIAFTIMIGAIGVPLSTLTVDRLNKMQPMYQLSELQKKEIIEYYEKLDKIVKRNAPASQKKSEIEYLKANSTFDKPGFPNHLFFLPPDREDRINLYLSPWYKAQATYNPKDLLPHLKCPILIINGSLDVFQSPDQNFPAIQKALLESGNKDFTLMVAPDVNHVMQMAKTGFPTEYAKLQNTVSPIILKTITFWLESRFITE